MENLRRTVRELAIVYLRNWSAEKFNVEFQRVQKSSCRNPSVQWEKRRCFSGENELGFITEIHWRKDNQWIGVINLLHKHKKIKVLISAGKVSEGNLFSRIPWERCQNKFRAICVDVKEVKTTNSEVSAKRERRIFFLLHDNARPQTILQTKGVYWNTGVDFYPSSSLHSRFSTDL